jgi:hypothetical protein
VVHSGLAAVPYLFRRRQLQETVELLERVDYRDTSLGTIHRVLGYLEQVLGEADPDQRLVYDGVFGRVLARVDPVAGQLRLRATMNQDRARGRFDLAFSGCW